MKTIYKMMFVFIILVVGGNSAHAQYGPGSLAWDYQMMQRENAIRMQNSMMQAQILNYYNQQAAYATQQLMNNPLQPIQGVMTYDGVYITPETVNNYRKEKVECSHCNGGYNYRTIYMGGGESRRIKSRCNYCHGTGTVTRTVKD